MKKRRAGLLRDRPGMSAVESAVVYPVTMLLLIGTMVVGLGNFRYQQLQSLARDAARYASVRGPNYVAANASSGASLPTAANVQTYVQGRSAGMSGLECTDVSYSSNTDPCTVSVTLSYTWKPEGYFSAMTWTATSTMPVTY
jgi:Flp pilus assembly protein TadG